MTTNNNINNNNELEVNIVGFGIFGILSIFAIFYIVKYSIESKNQMYKNQLMNNLNNGGNPLTPVYNQPGVSSPNSRLTTPRMSYNMPSDGKSIKSYSSQQEINKKRFTMGSSNSQYNNLYVKQPPPTAVKQTSNAKRHSYLNSDNHSINMNGISPPNSSLLMDSYSSTSPIIIPTRRVNLPNNGNILPSSSSIATATSNNTHLNNNNNNNSNPGSGNRSPTISIQSSSNTAYYYGNNGTSINATSTTTYTNYITQSTYRNSMNFNNHRVSLPAGNTLDRSGGSGSGMYMSSNQPTSSRHQAYPSNRPISQYQPASRMMN